MKKSHLNLRERKAISNKKYKKAHPEKIRAQRAKDKAKYYRFYFRKNSRKRYTEEEVELILAQSVSDKELANKLGRSVKAIELKRHFTKNPKGAILDEQN